jgi:hypothetical protein
MTGKWFEFNDEVVKLLPDGPSSSFDPDDIVSETARSGVDKKQVPSLAGSQDAYNMYYVEEEYLSKTVHTAASWRSELYQKGPNAGEVLDEVNDLRKGQFREISKYVCSLVFRYVAHKSFLTQFFP